MLSVLILKLPVAKKTNNFDDGTTMYPVSYPFVVAFHLSLSLEKIFVVRRFHHTFEQLNNVGYLSNEMILSFDPITVQQLKSCAQAFSKKMEKFSLSEMFSWELKFVID